jgi:hypothetical protein
MNSYADYLIFVLEFICIVGMVRSLWIIKNDIKHLKIFGRYYNEKLPSYSKMMLQFWVWDFTKFFKY